MSTENITPASYTVFKDKDNLYKAKSSSGTILALGPDAVDVIQNVITTMSGGGNIALSEGTFVMNSGIFLPVTATRFYDFGGAGSATLLQFNGSGFCITISGSTSSLQDWCIHDFRIDGVTLASGRDGIRNAAIGPHGKVENIYLKNLSTGYQLEDSNSFTHENIQCITCNVGIRTIKGANSNPNAVWFNHIRAAGCDKAIDFVATSGSASNFGIRDSNLETNGMAIEVNGNPRNVTIDAVACEANQSGDIWLKGISNTLRITNARISNCRGQGQSGSTGPAHMIKVDFADNVTIDNCTAVSYSGGSMVLLNQNVQHELLITNPHLESTPYLLNVPSDGFLTTVGGRLAGTVIENSRVGFISHFNLSGMASGDVGVFLGGAALFASSTTSGDTDPGVVMYPSAGINRPGVVCEKGIMSVNLNSTNTAPGDTLVTAGTSKLATVNNTLIDPKSILGYAVNTVASGAGSCFARMR